MFALQIKKITHLNIKISLKAVLFFVVFSSSSLIYSQTFTFTTAGAGSHVAPVSGTVTVETWGGGGAGGGTNTSSAEAAGGGGGGGGYARSSFSVTSGTTINFTIGAGGVAGYNSGPAGGTTTVNAPFLTSATGGAGGAGSVGSNAAGGAGGSGVTGSFLYNGGLGKTSSVAGTSYGGGGGGSAGTGSNGNPAPAVPNGATAVAGGGAGGLGGNTSSTNVTGGNGSAPGGGGGGAASYSAARKGGNGGVGKVVLTYSACSFPTASTISGATNPCIGTSQVYTTGTTGATTYGWTFPTGWVVTAGANTASITVTVGVGTGNITMSPSNGCGTGATQTLSGVTTCTAAAPQTIIFATPGTFNWTVPAAPSCASVLLTVQAWGAGGGGGGAASNQSSGGNEACSEGGGGGGGGYTTRSYTVTSGQTYTIVVGAGGTAGLGSSASAAACNGGAGGNSTFSGPATVGPGTLTAYGGAGGGGALTNNTSGASHLGNDGAGGVGGSGANGTLTYSGGSGSSGAHSGSCADVSGAGGGGAGTSSNGGNGSTVGGCALRTGGTGGASDGGNGANGGRLVSLAASREYTAGIAGSSVGGGCGGAMIHLNNWPNTWTTRTGGAGANGKVIISASISSCVLPIELTSFTGMCENNQTTIEWVTSTEINNDFFTLEQSADGASYSEVTKVQGAGNSNVNNYYKTALESSKEDTYFRLKQTDYDGQFAYSKPIYVKCDDNNYSTDVYPNPATNEINVKYDFKNKDIVGYIINVLGERVKSFNSNSDNNILNISIADLPNGLYNVILGSTRTGEFLSSTKFIKK